MSGITKKLLEIVIVVIVGFKRVKSRTFQEPRYTKDHVIGRKKELHPEPEHDLEIHYDEWIQYHNQRNWTKKYPILAVTQKYFRNSSDKISRIQLINLGVDYMIYEMAHHHIKLSFSCIHDMKILWRKAFKDYFTDHHHHSKFYNITDIYGYFNGLGFLHIFHTRTPFVSLPLEFRHKLKEHFDHVSDRDFREMFNWFEEEEKAHLPDSEIKRERLNKQFKAKYHGVEWRTDGRRVIDDDYDDLEPKYERKHHKIKIAKHRLNDEELTELLSEIDL